MWKKLTGFGFVSLSVLILTALANLVVADGPPFPGGGSGGSSGGSTDQPPPPPPVPFNYGQGLYLLPPTRVDANTLALTITNPVAGAAYDLLSTSNLNEVNLSNWRLLGHIAPGQIKFNVSPLSTPEGYFILRQSFDSDDDGTPDYLEDLDGNGIVDSGETDPYSATDPGMEVHILSPTSGSRVL